MGNLLALSRLLSKFRRQQRPLGCTTCKLDKALKDDVVFIGSSRVLFDIQLNKWEQETGKRPIQLALGSASPLPVLHDIAENVKIAEKGKNFQINNFIL